MPDDAQVQVPELPESANSTGQQVATSSPTAGELVEGQLLTPSSPYSELAAHFRGLASGRESLNLNPTARAMTLAAMELAASMHRTDRAELTELRREHKSLQEQFANLRVNNATACADLRRERSVNKLRSFMSNLGAVILGLIPYAADKTNWVGGLICAIFGVLLLAGGWRILRDERSQAQRPPTSTPGEGGGS